MIIDIINEIDEIDVLDLYAGQMLLSVGDDGALECFTDFDCYELDPADIV